MDGSPTFDLGTFRIAVARYVKLLIRARWKSDPGFLTAEELTRWGLSNIEKEPYPAWSLLEQAAHALTALNEDYLFICPSGGVSVADESTPQGRIQQAVVGLAYWDYGGPDIDKALVHAAKQLRTIHQVEWQSLVAWERLPGIRDDLDKLPHPGNTNQPALAFGGVAEQLHGQGVVSAKNPRANRITERLDQWAIGIEHGSVWHVFKKIQGRWDHQGKVTPPISRGHQNDLLMAFADRGGYLSKVDAIKVFCEKPSGDLAAKAFSEIKTVLSRVRATLRNSLNLDKTKDPIPWQKDSRGFRAVIEIGFVDKDDNGRLQIRLRTE